MMKTTILLAILSPSLTLSFSRDGERSSSSWKRFVGLSLRNWQELTWINFAAWNIFVVWCSFGYWIEKCDETNKFRRFASSHKYAEFPVTLACMYIKFVKGVETWNLENKGRRRIIENELLSDARTKFARRTFLATRRFARHLIIWSFLTSVCQNGKTFTSVGPAFYQSLSNENLPSLYPFFFPLSKKTLASKNFQPNLPDFRKRASALPEGVFSRWIKISRCARVRVRVCVSSVGLRTARIIVTQQ